MFITCNLITYSSIFKVRTTTISTGPTQGKNILCFLQLGNDIKEFAASTSILTSFIMFQSVQNTNNAPSTRIPVTMENANVDIANANAIFHHCVSTGCANYHHHQHQVCDGQNTNIFDISIMFKILYHIDLTLKHLSNTIGPTTRSTPPSTTPGRFRRSQFYLHNYHFQIPIVLTYI